MQVIGHLGKDAEIKIHGTEAVINFSVAHTDKWTDNGVKKERTTWVSCSWWTDRQSITQWLKKGTQVYVEGVPEAKLWKKKDDPQPYLNLRVYSLQLLGGQRSDGNNQNTQPSQNAPAQTQNAGVSDNPYAGSNNSSDDDSLPF